MSANTNTSSSLFTIKPLKLKPQFKSRKQAFTTLENAKKGAEASRRRAQERKERLERNRMIEDNQAAHKVYYARLAKGGF